MKDRLDRTIYKIKKENDRLDRIDEQALAEFSDLISSELIPGLIRIADKYNYDRDNMVQYCATRLSTISELATFKNYKLEGGSDNGN